MDDDFDENDQDAQYDAPPDHAGVQIMPPVIFLGFLVFAIILEFFMGADIFRWSAQLTIGILLLSSGSGLISWCFFLFSNKGTNLSPNQPTITLVTDGPYRISRNPIYLGMSCLYLGTVILFDILWGLPLFIPLIYIINSQVIVLEEKYLSRKFRGVYSEYCTSTRRWL